MWTLSKIIFSRKLEKKNELTLNLKHEIRKMIEHLLNLFSKDRDKQKRTSIFEICWIENEKKKK